MVALQVARVRGSLVDVSLRRLQLTLQLNDEDAAADEQQRVWPSRLHRQFVFEDRGIVPRQLIAKENLFDLVLQSGNRVRPGPLLLWRCVGDEVPQPLPNIN